MQALRHSKVKLTWDDDDPERIQMTRRTLSKKEIEEADFKAYLASSSSESDDEDVPSAPHIKKKADKKAASRDALRSLLLGGSDELPEGWGRDEDDPGDVDMEITFTPGLSANSGEQDDTTLSKYQRKVKEKRKKRKEEVKQKTSADKSGGMGDDFFDTGNADEVDAQKTSKHKKRAEIPTPTPRPVSTPEELALLVTSDNQNAEPQHFNLRSVLKAEKNVKRKGRKSKKGKDLDDNEVQEDFAIDVKDERFKVLHEDHHYAIDPSNPQCVISFSCPFIGLISRLEP